MDDLNELAIFVAVVDHGSFTGAAKALVLPKATVSRRIAALEARLGARLMQRTTRSVRLTELGEAYYERCAAILRDVDDANALVGAYQHEPRGLLRIAAPVSFGATVLADWVAQYLREAPGVEVEVVLANAYADILGEGIDVAFRVGPLPESSLVARKLGPMSYLLCAAPAYLAARGTPTQPDDLREHDCIRLSAGGQRTHWQFAGPGGAVKVPVKGRVLANDVVFARSAALDGLGLAYIPGFLVAADIRAGRLVPVMQAWIPPSRDMFAVYASRGYLSPKLRNFLDLVVANVTPQPPWLLG